MWDDPDNSRLEPGSQDGDLAEMLRGIGVAEDLIPEVEGVVFAFSMRLSAEGIRKISMSLGRSPAGKALEIALAGTGGRSYEAHAAEVGCDRSNLFRAVQRVNRRLARAQNRTTTRT